MNSRGRREAQATAQAFRNAIRDVLSCVSSDGVIVITSSAGAEPTNIIRPIANPTRLPGATRLFLEFQIGYSIDQAVDAGPLAVMHSYIYTLFDSDRRRIFGYHWHPVGQVEDGVTTPHLHIYVDVDAAGRSLGKLHFPTGPVAFTDIVSLLIRDLRVPPARRSWRAILQRHHQAFLSSLAQPRS